MTKCFIHLGKHGDLIILMPGWKRIHSETGTKPVVMVSKEFSSTLEACSYVEPWVVPLHWYGDIGQAEKLAWEKYGRENCVTPKWWDSPSFTPPAIRNSPTQLIIHGKRMEIEKDEWFSYMASQWKYAGFPMEHFMDQPVMDIRNREYEQHVVLMLRRTMKPLVLTCLNTGGSSPFPFEPEINRMVRQSGNVELIDLMKVRVQKIQDLLGLMEAASLIITSDTAILHLAGATKTPYVAYLANGGGGSIPRGNCILKVRYAETRGSFEQLNLILNQL